MGILVSGDWLLARLGDPGIVVLDCRYDLADPPAAARGYLAGHVPGARRLDLDSDLSGPRGDRPNGLGRHPLPTPDAFAATLRAAGVSRGSTVVAYDQAMAGGAARAWWLLRHLGHDAAHVLDGGLAGWDGPLASGEEPPAVPGDLEPGDVRADDLADHAALLAPQPGRLIVDVRAPERFRGEVEPLDPVAGHIPGAVNAPFGTMPPAPAWLVAHPGPIVASCGSGVTACVALLALAEAGREDALLYAGSWSDWSTRGLPVATGA